MSLPNKLYHYTTKDKILEIIESKIFLPSTINNWNDPFDCNHEEVIIDFSLPNSYERLYNQLKKWNPEIGKKIEEKLKKESNNGRQNYIIDEIMFKDHFKQIKNEYKVFCFSAAPVEENVLQWAHYAKNSGVALEFDFSGQKEFNNDLKSVIYNQENSRGSTITPDIFLELLKFHEKKELPNELVNDLYKKFLLYKHNDWKYEAEWRIIVKVDPSEEQSYTISLNTDILKCIYFGPTMSQNDKKNIYDKVNKTLTKLKFCELTKHPIYMKYKISEYPSLLMTSG